MITTHVLDTALGGPAVGLAVVLEMQRASEWVRLANAQTDDRGRVSGWDHEVIVAPGVYRLTFDTATYHRDVRSFFPEVQVTFKVREGTHHVHVPLLLSPFGFSTYKGV